MIFSSQLGKLDGVSTDEQLRVLSNHLRKMQEELEYRLSVLDSSNINEIDADQTNIFTKGANIVNVIATQDGKVSVLQQTVDGFKQQVSEYEKGYSEWEQTVEGFRGTVSDYGNKVSQYQQTVDGFQNTVADYGNSVSLYQQTVDGFRTQVQNYAGQVSNYSQTVDAFNWQVQNFNSNLSTTLRLGASGVYVIDQNGYTTTITGDHIKTNSLYGSNIYLRYPSGSGYANAGLITVGSASTAGFAYDLTSYGALRMTAQSGDAYIGAAGHVTLSGSSGNSSQGNFRPSGNNSYTLGMPYYRWADIYAVNSAINTSDRELKTDIVYGLDEYEETFMRLRPVSFKFKDGTSGRKHTGFVSQDVEEDLAAGGLTDMDFAGFVKSPKVDEDGKEIEGEYEYALRYGEFIALNTHMIQKLIARVEELEGKIGKE